ncbi:MAG: ornithine carbamoyltransferase subunit F, partial [Planctomycetes bacterium]|nr:ornithine carbamoyltransferase subunit F [Planctomycetota bacterium]
MNLNNRDFLKEIDFTKDEFLSLIDLAIDLKAQKRERREVARMVGRNIALIFEKTSTRTRCAFEVAAFDQGAHTTYLDGLSSQVGHKESIADTARVLSRYYDAI